MTYRTALVTTAVLVALAAGAGARGPGGNGKGHGGGPKPVDCEAARCAVQDAIANCPCDTATNHGSYVRCVAHAVKDAARAQTIPNRCKGKIVRCAARSTCGKPDKVTCVLPQLGHCNVTTGTCDENTSITCQTDAECVLGERCKIRSAEDCQTAGGTAGTGSCCAVCASPNGAFID